jgi:hypothetical protein
VERLDWAGTGLAPAPADAAPADVPRKPSPGGLGSPSAPTMWGCLQWLDEVRRRAAKAAWMRARKYGPENRNRRGGAPKGDAPRSPFANVLAAVRPTADKLARRKQGCGGYRHAPFGALPPRIFCGGDSPNSARPRVEPNIRACDSLAVLWRSHAADQLIQHQAE